MKAIMREYSQCNVFTQLVCAPQSKKAEINKVANKQIEQKPKQQAGTANHNRKRQKKQVFLPKSTTYVK
jgi:hypothetical protein